MIRQCSQIIFVAAVLLVPMLAGAQDFGLDINLGLKKKIVKGLSASAEFELQTQDMSSEFERINAGLDISYKPIDYFKFGAGYNFIDKYYPKHSTDDDNTIDSYWSPRHRINVYVTGILPFGDFELSLRERYQYTYRAETSAAQRNSSGVAQESKKIKSKHSHVLRSRLLASYRIKPIKLSPYLSLEMYNDLTSSFEIDKLKLTVGLEYSFQKHHGVELFYRYVSGIADANDECHLLGMGYEFKF